VVIGDVNGDGLPEIVTTFNSLDSTADPFFTVQSFTDAKVLAIRSDGSTFKAWQLASANGCFPQFFPAPAIGDFDQRGVTEIAVSYVVSGCVTNFSSGMVTLLKAGGTFNPLLNDWPLVRHDARNTSVLRSPDFSLAASGARTVNAGSPATYTITVAPNPGAYNFAVSSFSCSGLPTGASCDFNPTAVTPNTASQSVALTISTTPRTFAAIPPGDSLNRLYAAWLGGIGALAFLMICAFPGEKRRRRNYAWMAAAAFGCILLANCGAGNHAGSANPNGTPAGTFPITVSASGNNGVPHTTAVTLNVN